MSNVVLIEFVAIAAEIGGSVPRGHAELRDQLGAQLCPFRSTRRGGGRTSEADAHGNFAIALGSAMECAAVLDVVRALGALGEERYGQAIALSQGWSPC